MKFGVVNKSTIVNKFVLHTLQRNITHLAVITRKTNIKLGILKGGGTGKEPVSHSLISWHASFVTIGQCEQKFTCKNLQIRKIMNDKSFFFALVSLFH